MSQSEVHHFEKTYRPAAFWILTILVLAVAVLLLKPFFAALAWAIVLSVLAYPLYLRFKKRMGETSAAAVTVLATIGAVALPLIIIGTIIVTQLAGFASEFQGGSTPNGPSATQRIVDSAEKGLAPTLKQLGIEFDFKDWYAKNGEELAKNASEPVGKAVGALGFGIFTLVVALFTMFFMLRDGHRLREPALDLLPIPRERASALFDKMGNTIRSVFIGVVLVAIIQAVLAFFAYLITGVSSPVMFAFATFILCVIPLLGGPVIYVPLSLMLLSQGKIWQGIFLLVFGFGVISQIDNVLRPFVIGSRVSMHPIGIFFSLLGGVLAFGPVGIVAGPVVLTVLLALVEIIRERRQMDDLESATEAA